VQAAKACTSDACRQVLTQSASAAAGAMRPPPDAVPRPGRLQSLCDPRATQQRFNRPPLAQTPSSILHGATQGNTGQHRATSCSQRHAVIQNTYTPCKHVSPTPPSHAAPLSHTPFAHIPLLHTAPFCTQPPPFAHSPHLHSALHCTQPNAITPPIEHRWRAGS
jgi:hypothetical protein